MISFSLWNLRLNSRWRQVRCVSDKMELEQVFLWALVFSWLSLVLHSHLSRPALCATTLTQQHSITTFVFKLGTSSMVQHLVPCRVRKLTFFLSYRTHWFFTMFTKVISPYDSIQNQLNWVHIFTFPFSSGKLFIQVLQTGHLSEKRPWGYVIRWVGNFTEERPYVFN
jgi:hypothetical protein